MKSENYLTNYNMIDSRLYIDSLAIAKKNGPTIKTSGSLKECNDWNTDFFNMLDEQMKLYKAGRGRLQTN